MKFLSRAMLVLLCGATPCTAATPAEIDALIARVETARRERDIPAVALTLVQPDRMLWSGALGIADRASGRPADAQTLFRIGSITKMFTALALLIAQDDGLIDLDAGAFAVVPDLPMRNPWEATHPLRIAHLLELTAGLPDLSRAEFDHNEPLELREALAWKAADRQALWPPGLHHSYTNVSAGLAALVLEKATGKRHEDFVRERIFGPLGMDSAGFIPDARTFARLATGYDADGVTPIPYWHMLYRAFGAIDVLPAQMGAFIRMLLNRGAHGGLQVLSAAAIDRMETPRTTLAAGTGLRFGYGLGNYTWMHHGVLFHGHGGDGDGFLARLGYSRERAMGYLIIINVFRGADLAFIQNLVEDFIAGHGSGAAPLPPLPASIPPERMTTFAGRYEAVTWRFNATPRRELSIEARESGLVLHRGKQNQTLMPVNDRHFRQPHEPIASSAFIEHEGRLYFQDQTGNYVKAGP